MVVKHNLLATNSNRMLGLTTASQAKSTEKLSSGYRINRAADDAAGLSISEKMRRQIRGLTQASSNSQDGVSFCQIADGALNEVHDMLHRAEELAVKASNGTLTSVDRSYCNEELTKLKEEIDRVAITSTFNEINIFSKQGHAPSEAGIKSIDNNRIGSISDDLPISIEWEVVGSDGNLVAIDGVQASGSANSASKSESNMAKFVVDAASNAVKKLADAYPNLFGAASSSGVKIGLDLSQRDGVGKTLAVAKLSYMGNGTDSVLSYSMQIDTADYPIDKFDTFSDAKKADLASTIAHEMTHIVMYDTTTAGMLDKSNMPKWFVEGMAQTSSGDNGWVSGSLNPSSTDASIKSYMSRLDSMEYGAGYLATMYLGLAASGNTTISPANVTSTNIRAGLDKILTDVAKGSTLDQAIKNNTSFSGLNDFQTKFKSASGDALPFVKELLNQRTTSGAGSLLGALSDSESSLFNPASFEVGSNYEIQKDNTYYSNRVGTGIDFPKNLGGDDGNGDGGRDLDLQVGAEAGQHIRLKRFNASYEALVEYNTMDVSTVENAQETIDSVKIGIENVSRIRSYYGATQNRLEHTIANLDNVVENTTAAESAIRDTDMAMEMVKYSNNNILAQAGQSMLAQANQSNQGVLSLLQ